METLNTGNVAQNGRRKSATLPELAAALGSKNGTDPIPPSQYLCFLGPGATNQEQLLAWVRSKTIRYRKQVDGSDGRSPFCVDDHLRPLSLADMARELKWKLPNASREWKKAERLGVVCRRGKKLLLVGDVKPLPEGKDRRNVICTDNIPPSILKKIRKWPRERQNEFEALWLPAVALAPDVEAAYAAKGREVIAEMYRSILTPFGLVEGKAKERKKRKPVKVPDHLVDFVQITLFDDVQITPIPPRTDNQKLYVQHPIYIKEAELLREERQIVVVGSEVSDLAGRLQIDDDAAKKLLEDCRRKDPESTVLELVNLAHRKLLKVGKTVRYRQGLILHAVPKMVGTNQHGEVRADIQKSLAENARLDAELAVWLREREPVHQNGSQPA